MRLLIATQALDERHPNLGFFVRWVEEFATHCESVIVVASSVGEYRLPKNVTVYTLGKEVGLEHRHRVGRFVSLMWTLRREYDAVFVHMIPEFVVAGAIPWVMAGKRVGLWYVHGTVSLWLALASVLVYFIATASAESCRISSPKVKVVGHGIDVAAIPQHRHIGSGLSVVSVGRIAPAKRPDIILDTVEILKGAGIPLTATLIGGPGKGDDADYAEDVRERAGIIGLSYRGALPYREALAVMAEHDVFISASETGSVDKAVLEAAAAGVVPVYSNPVFTTALGVPELQVEGTPESFAETIRALADDGEGRTLLATRVRTAVETNHSLQKLVPKILALYA